MGTSSEIHVDDFLSHYSADVIGAANVLRQLVLSSLPHIQEQIDLPAKMLAYSYGPKYVDVICVIIPSKKGVKLGFNRGVQLNDPANLLKGNGKILRYVEIKSLREIRQSALLDLLNDANSLYQALIEKR